MNKKILLLGNSKYLDFLSFTLNKNLITHTYLKISEQYITINFFDPVYIPEAIFSNMASELKFTFVNEEDILPVINEINFFQEIVEKYFPNTSDIFKFKKFLNSKFIFNLNAEKYFLKHFSENFFDIINAILYFYHYPTIENFNIKKLQQVLKNFFSKNSLLNNIEIPHQCMKIKSKEIKKFDKYVLIDKTPYLFDLLISDILDLNKNIITYTEKFVEFKIKKEYTTEYFPKIIIFKINNKFYKLNYKKYDEKYKYYYLTGGNTPEIIFKFLKNYFPLLRLEDLIIINSGENILKNIQINEKEKFSFNFCEKLIFQFEEVNKNGKKKGIK